MIDAATVKAALSGGGSATGAIVIGMFMFADAGDFNRHVAESLRGTILDQVERAAKEEPGEYKQSLCKSLDEMIAELCADEPDDAICMDRDVYRKKAGCA